MTAGHCVQSNQERNFVVRVGEHDLMRQESHSRDYNIRQIVIHHNYSKMSYSLKSWSQVNNADIALLQTTEDIFWNEMVWPVCFPSDNLQLAGKEAIVVGWGKQSEKSDFYSERLQKVKVTILGGKQCTEWFKLSGRDLGQITDQILCAGIKEGGKDAVRQLL